MDDGRWTTDDGEQTMENRRWTIDDGQQTMDNRRWTLCNNVTDRKLYKRNKIKSK